ncbi:MAG TPA: hypothetical protein VIW94_01280, partial [Acidimicrobiia bacterium]
DPNHILLNRQPRINGTEGKITSPPVDSPSLIPAVEHDTTTRTMTMTVRNRMVVNLGSTE